MTTPTASTPHIATFAPCDAHMARQARPWVIPLAGCAAFVGWTVLVCLGFTQPVDDWVMNGFYDKEAPALTVRVWWHEWARDVTALGSGAVLLLISTATFLWLGLGGKWWRAVVIVVGGMGVAMGLAEVFKYGPIRGRPGVGPLVDTLFTHSYPSSHAMSAAAVYVLLGLVMSCTQMADRQRRLCIGVGIVLACMVGATRIALGAHWPSDVVGGLLAGGTWAWTCWSLAQRWTLS